MSIFKMDEKKIPMLANLMSGIKPDWWDYEGAVAQLSDISNTVVNIGG